MYCWDNKLSHHLNILEDAEGPLSAYILAFQSVFSYRWQKNIHVWLGGHGLAKSEMATTFETHVLFKVDLVFAADLATNLVELTEKDVTPQCDYIVLKSSAIMTSVKLPSVRDNLVSCLVAFVMADLGWIYDNDDWGAHLGATCHWIVHL